jgi:hypothetical protein
LQSSEIIQHPVIAVSIGGVIADERPAKFEVKTLAGCPAEMTRLLYPADAGVGKIGDAITVSLISDGGGSPLTDLYFTGEIHDISVHGAYRELIITDSFKKLVVSKFTAAYRKEKAASILDDILAAAGITEKKITCPDVELARFSTQNITARLCIDLLIDALKEHGIEGLVYFFDEKDTFHFGRENDSGKNDGDVFNFESAKDILKRGDGWIEVLPRPVRHTQKIMIDGKETLTLRTSLIVSRKSSRLTIWTKEAAPPAEAA